MPAVRPIGELVVNWGPLVMNTREEIEQAMGDYRDGTLVQRGPQGPASSAPALCARPLQTRLRPRSLAW